MRKEIEKKAGISISREYNGMGLTHELFYAIQAAANTIVSARLGSLV
jgi:hypothetical protein